MEELLRTLGYTIVGTVIQKRQSPDPRYYLGKGKVEETVDLIEELGPDVVIVNDEVLPNQRFNIEQILGIEVFDRIRIILEIFRERAVSEEAKLQVELAGLRYEIPWLRELIHQAKVGEHPGLLAGGEYGTRQHYTRGRRTERQIRQRLAVLERNRTVMRSNRHRKGFTLVGITGYTNAGKSTLFNALTDENVLVDDRMFATLSTTTRRFGKKQPLILLTDTIGFLEDLPPWMIKAFNSTMEEVFQSDFVVLVIDATDEVEEIIRKTETCFAIIAEGWKMNREISVGSGGRSWTDVEEGIDDDDQEEDVVSDGSSGINPPQAHGDNGAEGDAHNASGIIAVLNKIDLMNDLQINERLDALKRAFPDLNPLLVSADRGTGLMELRNRLTALYAATTGMESFQVRVPENDYSAPIIHWIHEHSIVHDQVSEDGWRILDLDVPAQYAMELRKRLEGVGEEVSSLLRVEDSSGPEGDDPCGHEAEKDHHDDCDHDRS